MGSVRAVNKYKPSEELAVNRAQQVGDHRGFKELFLNMQTSSGKDSLQLSLNPILLCGQADSLLPSLLGSLLLTNLPWGLQRRILLCTAPLQRDRRLPPRKSVLFPARSLQIEFTNPTTTGKNGLATD